MHTNGVSITPHFGYQWYKYQGAASDGCLKRQIHLGWIIWSCQLLWKHRNKYEDYLTSYNPQSTQHIRQSEGNV